METKLLLVHGGGMLVALCVFNVRAGGSFWYGVHPRLLLLSPGWFVFSVVKAVGWELTFVIWLLGGQPPSPWGVRESSRSGRITRVTDRKRRP